MNLMRMIKDLQNEVVELKKKLKKRENDDREEKMSNDGGMKESHP